MGCQQAAQPTAPHVCPRRDAAPRRRSPASLSQAQVQTKVLEAEKEGMGLVVFSGDMVTGGRRLPACVACTHAPPTHPTAHTLKHPT